MPGLSGTLPCVPLPFAGFDLYPSAIIDHNCSITALLSSVSPSSELLDQEVVLETS